MTRVWTFLIRANEITILTPYVGQLLRLREEVSQFSVFMLDERDAEQLVDLQVGYFYSRKGHAMQADMR